MKADRKEERERGQVHVFGLELFGERRLSAEKWTSPRPAGKRSRRRGVLLLVILALLAMFALVAVAFVMLAGHERRSAKIIQRIDQQVDRPEQTLRQALLEVLRGSNPPPGNSCWPPSSSVPLALPNVSQSVIGAHSLLEDIYGHNTYAGAFKQDAPLDPQAPRWVMLGAPLPAQPAKQWRQLFEFGVPADDVTPSSLPDTRVPLCRTGCVLTVLTGRAAGQSTHIVGLRTQANPDPNNKSNTLSYTYYYQARAFDGGVLPQAGDRYMINGAPFSGPGFGYNPVPTAPNPPCADLKISNLVNSYQVQLIRAGQAGNGKRVNDLNAIIQYFNPPPIPPLPPPLRPIPADAEVALLPNLPLAVYYDPSLPTSVVGTAYGNPQSNPPAAVNSDYTAVDFQHMLLATPMTTPPTPMAFPAEPGEGKPFVAYNNIPSLHRPDLVYYWLKRMNPPSSTALLWKEPLWNQGPNPTWNTMLPLSLQRAIMLRPLPIDHPQFTGSNPAFNPIKGPWDVDNDGDGVPDSIWVDLGLPVRTMADGRSYKPLFAILCVDLDGRLNLNAHGCVAQTEPGSYDPRQGASAQESRQLDALFAGGQALTPLPRGQGYGPPDTSLLPLFWNGNVLTINGACATYQWLLAGDSNIPGYANPNRTLEGRYGDLVDPITGAVVPLAQRQPGIPNFADPLTTNKWFDCRGIGFQDVYGSANDAHGAGAVALDMAGRPLYLTMGFSPVYRAGSVLNCPYALNLSRGSPRGLPSPNAASDNPFSTGELERLLRPFDRDAAGLPSRLFSLSYDRSLGTSPLVISRHAITTESWDVPNAAPAAAPAPLGLSSRGIFDGLWGLLRDNCLRENRPDYLQFISQTISQLVAPELLAGMKMNINRPFGNGRDDFNPTGSINWVVDDPAESPSMQQPHNYQTYEVMQGLVNGSGQTAQGLRAPPNATAPYASTPPLPAPDTNNPALNSMYYLFDHLNNGDPRIPVDQELGVYSNGELARQLHARYLYVLAMLLTGSHIHSPPCYLDRAFNDNTGEAAARFLAQWAINVVDFLDRDSIMTRFDYDPDPFKPNDANGKPKRVQFPDPHTFGNLDAGYQRPTTWQPPQDGQHTVWGCERPELLISETLAFHDRRTEDLAVPGGTTRGTPPDPDFDQRRMPEGSLFIELYNPQSPLDPLVDDLYCYFYRDPITPRWTQSRGVVLNRTHNGLPDGDPVWRLIAVRPNTGISNVPGEQADPDDPVIANRPAIDRSIYFTDVSALRALDDPVDRRFYSSAGVASTTQPGIGPVLPGRYAVLGSGGAPQGTGATRYYPTYIGDPIDRVAPPDWRGRTRRIVLQPGDEPENLNDPNRQFNVFDNTQAGGGDLPAVNTDIKRPAAVVVIDQPRRLSVSEPVGGYPAVDAAGIPAVDGLYTTPYDHPFIGDPADVAALTTLGTTFDFRIVHLQRLANPLKAWDRDTNPYRTIDSMPVDLTVFNGVTAADEPGVTRGTVAFETRQRGERNDNPTSPISQGQVNMPTNPRNLWKQEPLGPSAKGTAWYTTPLPFGPLADHIFRETFSHTLGYLNKTYGAPATTAAGQFHMGDPQWGPFPWLTWNNRPFAGPLELLLVPTSSSSKLLVCNDLPNTRGHYDYVKTVNLNPYAPPAGTPANPVDFPYPHLLNFFQSDASHPAGAAVSPQLHRLLEYVCVPSRFAGTEILASPQWAVGDKYSDTIQGMPIGYPNALPFWFPHRFHNPFNRIPLMREPGRVNLNTIFDEKVLLGLINDMNDAANLGTRNDLNPAGPFRDTPLWQNFLQSRVGYDQLPPHGPPQSALWTDPATGAIGPYVDERLPTVFARPFRSFAGADMVPLSTPQAQPAVVTMRPQREIDVTLLRPAPGDPINPNAIPHPLFVAQTQPAQQHPYSDSDRNPYFRYQELQRLGNLVTTRSNVFAIWITVGYFEVRPWTNTGKNNDQANGILRPPDGYLLQQELGSDTGEIERHRGFFMIDRTIPVGFQRGQDLNVENALLLQRYIE